MARAQSNEFASRMNRARKALLCGKAASLAYSLGVTEGDVARVGGVASNEIRASSTSSSEGASAGDPGQEN
jgi:hypothetical protein